ncbi:hypothetical protein OAD50_00850 [Vicingaceae bacterium]|nr:hypothetical protein [Vicingaceae bacterium]
MKNQLKEYFYFSRFERTGIIGLVILIVLLIFGRTLFFEYYPEVEENQKVISKIEARIHSLKQEQRKRESQKELDDIDLANFKNLEDFNPNNLEEEGW